MVVLHAKLRDFGLEVTCSKSFLGPFGALPASSLNTHPVSCSGQRQVSTQGALPCNSDPLPVVLTSLALFYTNISNEACGNVSQRSGRRQGGALVRRRQNSDCWTRGASVASPQGSIEISLAINKGTRVARSRGGEVAEEAYGETVGKAIAFYGGVN